MKEETEGLMATAQNQAVTIRWSKVHIEKQPGTSMCRMCNQKKNDIAHPQGTQLACTL